MQIYANTKSFDNYTTRITEAISKIDIKLWNDCAEALYDIWFSEKNVFLAGNGGSASTVNHFSVDWSKGLATICGRPMRAYSLVSNIPLITALSNDNSYEAIFSDSLKYFAKQGDMLLIVSGSGNSKNVINAVQTAKDLGLKSIGLTGYDGGQVSKLVDFNANVPFDNMQIVEDIHSMFGHFVLEYIFSKTNSNLDD